MAAKELKACGLVAPRIVGFHAQQAAEKALKSVLSRHGIDFPKTHSLVALEALLPPETQQVTSDVDLASLSTWAVQARYPAEEPDTEADSANDAISVAERLMDVLGLR